MLLRPIRRIVTGHDADGQAIIAADGRLPTVVELSAVPGTIFHEVWSTQGSPASVDNGPDPSIGPIQLPPPRHGTRIRFVDIPPDTEDFLRHGTEKMKDAFHQIGDAGASTVKAGSPHPLMHRTETIDYGIVIAGEITLVLDKRETLSFNAAPITRGRTGAASRAACCSFSSMEYLIRPCRTSRTRHEACDLRRLVASS